ncbi:MAG: peptidoglycan DD-metalloendopeptidase family protein, partial [Peptostreptococcaceae bacterium]
NTFKGAYSTVKTSVKDAYDPIFSLFRTQERPAYGPRIDNIPGKGGPIRPQLRKELTTTSEGKATLEFARDMFKHKVNGIANNMYEHMPHFDKGGYIEKSTVATVGEGEVVISKDNVNNLIGSLQQALGDHPAMAKINRRVVPTQLGKDVRTGIGNVRSALFGDEAKDRKSMALVIDDVTTNISRYAPEAIGSGLLGAGVSLITGAIGGPLLGAAVGAGMSLTKNSEKIQNYLFGEKINDERQGGLVSKDFMKSITKYLPDLKTYGIAGAATGLLPLIPFGPVGGLLLGSSFAFAKNNKAIQESLFGEEGGLISPDSKEKIKKMLPRIGLGAAVGLFTGPFGLVGNAMLGSGIGMLTTTDKFNQLVLGNKDSDGKYQGGFLPTLRDTVIDPIKGYMKGLGDRITDFMKEKMFKPLASAFAPMKKQVELLTKGMFDKVGNFMNDMFEKSFGIPLNKFMEEKLIKPITGWLSKWILRPVKGAAKGIISAPFKLAGGIGNALRKSHIRSGNADYMTAEERMKFREERNIYTMGLFGKDKFANVDRALAGMSGEDLSGVMDELSNVVSSEQSLGSQRKKVMNTLVSDLIPNFKYNESKNLMRLIQQGGSSKELASYIMNNTPHLSKEGRYKLLKQLSKNASKMKDLDNQRIDSKYAKTNLFNKLKAMGLNVNDSNINNYISLLTKESKSRNKSVSTVNDIVESPMNTIEDQSNAKHNKIVDLFNDAIFLLKKIANPSYVASGEDNTIQSNLKLYKGKSNPKKRKSGFTQIAGNGTALDYIVNSNGETVLDPSDNENREFLEEQAEEKSFKNRFMDLISSTKNKLNEGKETVKEKGKGIFDSIVGGLGTLGTILKVAAIPAIYAYFKSEGFRNAVNGFISGIFGMVGDGIAGALGFDTKKDAVNNAMGVGARHVLTGGSTSRFGLKWIAKAFAPKDLSGKGILSRMKAAPGQAVRKGMTGLFGLADKGVTGVGNLLDQGVEAGKKSNIFNTLKNKAGKLGKDSVNAISDAATNNEIIQSMIKTMDNFIKDILTHPTVVRIVGEASEKILSKAVPKIMKEVAERAAKAGTKAVIKVVGGLSTGGILNIIWAVADFISGFNDARNIMGIVQEPSFGMKLCTGLIKALNGLFIVTAFIPEETWVNLFLDYILPLFGKEDSNIQKMREESRNIVEKYSTENGLDKMSVQDYNDMNKKSWWQKTKDTTKNIWNSVKNFGSRVSSSTKKWFNGEYKSTGPTQRPLNEGGMGGERPSYSSKKKRSKYKYVGTGGAAFGLGRGGENTQQLTEANIRYHDLRKLAGGNPTASSINQWIAKVTKNDPRSLMNGQGAAFVEAGKKYGLDPRYIAAHAAWESGWGRSEIVHAKNNFFGIAAYNASPGESAWSFKTPKDGILEGARFISEEYANAGQPTLHSMIHGNPTHRYAVYDDGSPNTGWIDGISNIFYNSPGIGEGVLNMDASSMAGESGESGDSGKPSIWNMVTDLGTAFAKDFNKMMGFSNDEDPMSGGSGMSGGGSSSGNPADDFFTRTLGATVSSKYAENRSAEGLGDSHGGIDYAAKTGTSIKSPISGKVVLNSFESGGFGNHVYVQDKNGKNHIFAHLNSRSPLKNGSQVKPGDIIGQVGNTGLSTGPHLHYEVRGASRSDKSDPNKYLSQLYPNNELNSVGSERVKMELPEENDKKEAKGGQNTNYDKLLIKIIEVLLKIADNSDSLSKIVDILSNQMGMEIPNSAKKSIQNRNSNSKAQIINIIKDSAINSNPDNEYLLNLLDGIATQ